MPKCKDYSTKCFEFEGLEDELPFLFARVELDDKGEFATLQFAKHATEVEDVAQVIQFTSLAQLQIAVATLTTIMNTWQEHTKGAK